MAGNYRKEDLRVIKTQRALKDALTTLLEAKSFKRITVNDICEEALTSRAAFYSHYCDKYTLLKALLDTMINEKMSYEEVDEILVEYVYEKNKFTKNLLDDADSETIEVLQGFILKIIERSIGVGKEKNDPDYQILINFCLGGIIQVINWQIKNYYPDKTMQTKRYFHEIVRKVASCDLRFFDKQKNEEIKK